MTKFITTILTALALCTPALAGDGCCGGNKAKTAKTEDGCGGCGGICGGDAPKTKLPPGIKTAKGCGGCKDKAKTAKKTSKKQVALSARIAHLQAAAKKGCKTSAAKLAKLLEATKLKSQKDLLARVTKLEGNCKKGCKMSAKELARLNAVLSPKQVALSKRIATWTAAAKKGCKQSAAKLAAVKAACDTGCEYEAAQKVAKLEAAAKKGCKQSAAKLAKIEASLKKATAKKATKPETASK